MTATARTATALACLAIILVGFALGLEAAREKTVTYDERHYIAFASDLADGKTACGYTLHPPLSLELTELGLRLAGNRQPVAARTPHLVLFALFGLVVAAWAGQLYDGRAAIAASVLYAFEPNFLAHASLAATDFPVTAAFVVNLWTLRAFLRRATLPRAMLWALTFGVAQMTKQSALLLLPASALVFVALLATGGIRWQRAWLWGLVLAPLAVVLIGYVAYGMTWCGFDAYRATSLLRITQNKTGAGYSIYVLGHVYDHGVWYYFLVTTALKEPLPLLALILLAAVCRPAPRDGQQETAYLLIPAVVVFLAGSFSIHQLGHRYILPAFPLLVIWVSGLAASPPVARWRRVPPFLVWALIAFHVGDAFRIRPNYLAYFNQLIGSPENGYHYLADSNMDWLQDEHAPEIEALRQHWDLVNPDQSPLKLDPSKPPALLLGATDLSGAWAEAGFWGSRFTKLVREKHYRHVAHVGYSRFLFPLDTVGLYQDLYAHVLSRSWVDAENVRRRFATLAGLDEPPLPSFAALRPSDDAPCARGVRRTTMRDGGDEVTIVDGFQPPSPGTPVRLVRWSGRWRVEGGDYVVRLPPPGGAEPDVTVSLDGRSLLFVRGSEDKAFRFAAVHLERGEHDLDVSLPAGRIGAPSLEASVVRREPNGLVTGQGVPLEAALCAPP